MLLSISVTSLSKRHKSNQMVSENISTEAAQSLSKSEQLCTNTNVNVVSADIIRTAEIRMQQRGMLPGGQTLCHNPFWFLVETEKNVFLWRSGCSLEDKDNFEFLVDVDSLLDKRLNQLERQYSSDPTASILDNFDLSLDPVKAETEYLKALKETILPILNHLSALSEVQLEIISEHCQQTTTRVVLPYSKVAGSMTTEVAAVSDESKT